MTTIVFPLDENAPKLNYSNYQDISWYTLRRNEIKKILNVCKFDFPHSVFNVHHYGMAHLEKESVSVSDSVITTVGMIIVPKNKYNHIEMYSVCTDQMHRKQGYAKIMIANVLKYFTQFYKYAWIAVDASHHSEVYFKSLVKMYGQVGFQYYPTYGTQSPLGIQLPSGFVQLINPLSKYNGQILKIVNPYTIQMAWKCAKLKATPQNIVIHSSVFENIYNKYGHFPLEYGGTLLSTQSFPSKDTDKLIPMETIKGPNLATLSKGDEHSMTVSVPHGLYSFHTHPTTAIQLLKSVFAWPSIPDIGYTIFQSVHGNPKMSMAFVLSCEGFYITHMNEYARAIVQKFNATQFNIFLKKYTTYLQKELWEQQRYIWSVYFQEFGWSTELHSKDPANFKTYYFKFISPTGKEYSSLKDVVQNSAGEFKYDKTHFTQFMHKNLKQQIEKMNKIIGVSLKHILTSYTDTDTFLVNKYNQGIPIMYINFVPYSYKTPISQIIYNKNNIQIPELHYESVAPAHQKKKGYTTVTQTNRKGANKISPILKRKMQPQLVKRKVTTDKMDVD